MNISESGGYRYSSIEYKSLTNKLNLIEDSLKDFVEYEKVNDFYKISIGHILTSFIPIFNIISIIFYIVLFYLDREHIKCKILVPKDKLEKIIYLFWN